MKTTLCALVASVSLIFGCETKPRGEISGKTNSNFAYKGNLPEKCSNVLGMSYSGGSGANFQVACENVDKTYSLYILSNSSWSENMRLQRNK